MKLLVLLLFIGVASAASLYDVLDDAADEIVRDFIVGMEQASSLKDVLGLEDIQAAEEDEDGIKTELVKTLKEALDNIMGRIKEALDHGKIVKEETLEKLQEIREKLKGLKVDIGEKARKVLESLKDKAKDFLKKLLEKLGFDKKRRSLNEIDTALADFSIKDIFRRLRDALLKKIDKDALKAKIEELFGKGSELADRIHSMLLEKGEQGKKKLLELIDRILGKDEEEKRSLKELYDKIKDFFKEKGLEIKEKFVKVGEFIKEKWGKVLEHVKDKNEAIKKIGQEFIDHSKGISKELAAEFLEFFRQYKEDLGSLYEQIKETAKEILNRKD